jgi:Rrf2 family protein
VSHKVDYGLLVVIALAEREQSHPGRPLTTAVLAAEHQLPAKFLGDVLRLLRNATIVRSVRGIEGGWVLARPAETITVADVIRVLDGALVTVRGVRPHELPAHGAGASIVALWIAARAALRSVLEHVTIADLASGELPHAVAQLADDPDAWDSHRAADGRPVLGGVTS